MVSAEVRDGWGVAALKNKDVPRAEEQRDSLLLNHTQELMLLRSPPWAQHHLARLFGQVPRSMLILY